MPRKRRVWRPPATLVIGGETWRVQMGISPSLEGQADSTARAIRLDALTASACPEAAASVFFHELHHAHSTAAGVLESLVAILRATGLEEDRATQLASDIDEIYARAVGQAEWDTLSRNKMLAD